MGTRNLTCVVVDGKFKVAQYCQWDGYPSGQGATVLSFLTSGYDKAAFIEKLNQTNFISDAEHKALWKEIDPGNDTGFVDLNKSNEFKNKYPQLDRDMGADVLEHIANSEAGVLLKDDSEFAKDGLFCEWAYVIDYDTNRLYVIGYDTNRREVYKGFGKKPLEESERFYGENVENDYAPVRIIGYYDLDNLPDEDTFVAAMDNVEDDVEDDVEDSLNKVDIYAVLDSIRNSDHGDELMVDRVCNYMEANIDEFIETYE